jgi:hypothetical protein
MQVLAFREGGVLVTGDKPDPVPLGKLPDEIVQQFGGQLKNGLMLRFKIGTEGFFLDGDGAICGADLVWLGVANQSRARADLYSRIVFQWQMRTGKGIGIESILRAVQANADLQMGAPLPMSTQRML